MSNSNDSSDEVSSDSSEISNSELKRRRPPRTQTTPRRGSKTHMVLTVWRYPCDITFKVSVECMATTLDLTRAISILQSALPFQQQLIFNGTHLEDTRLLVDYGIEDGATVYILLKREHGSQRMKLSRLGGHVKIDVFVKSLAGKIYPILVTPMTTVAEVKRELKAFTGIPAEWQRLIYRSEELDDGHHLSDCGIKEEDTITLIRKLTRGGGWISLELSKDTTVKKLTHNPGERWMWYKAGLNIVGECKNRFCLSQWYQGKKRQVYLHQGYESCRLTCFQFLLECPVCLQEFFRPVNFIVCEARALFLFRNADGEVSRRVEVESAEAFPKKRKLAEEDEEVIYASLLIQTEKVE